MPGYVSLMSPDSESMKRLPHSECSSMSLPILQYMQMTSLLTASTARDLAPEISHLTRSSVSM